MSLFRLGLIVSCFWPLLQRADSEHVRITLRPAQSEIGALELTVPALVKTMTELSLVTVTQLSMETTTVEGARSAAGTAPVATALAISQTSSSPSSLLQTPAPEATVMENSSSAESSTVDTRRPSEKSTSTAVQLPNTLQDPCNCQCLCPQSAFQVYGAMGATPGNPTASTLPSLVTAGQRQLPAESSASLAVSSSSEPPKSFGLTSDAASSSSEPTKSFELTSDAASSSAGPTVTPIQLFTSEPFNISTYSLLDSVTVALSL